ncbi:MAG: peptide ABC transporter substrate-binding protein [Chloroflexota bacterium]|nr:peptide ABC transporter substrate-binding protein [Chloroflexota bacterium]
MPLTQTRWPFFVALTAGVLTVALFWYFVLSDPKGEAVPASGGHYVEGVTQAPDRLNPLFTGTNDADADVASLVFSGLVQLGPDGTPEPDLAERWEITGNGQSYVFHLRRGIDWHDGQAFGAEDVVFTFKAITDPGFKGDPALADLMQGVVVTARDALTVEFKLEQAYAPFLAYLTLGILPKHLLQNLDANQLFNAEFNARPVGTGAYRFGKRTDHGVQLESNSTYYLGPPRISTIEFRTYPDSGALAEALRSGQVDGALLGPATSPDTLAALSGDPSLAVHDLVSNSYNTIYMDTRSPLFSDKTVRRALFQAINQQSLIDDSAGGRGVPATTGISPNSWAYTPPDMPPFDPGAAASALELAGWQRGRDGVRQKGGLRLAFAISTTNEAARVAVAEDLVRQWRAIGAEVQVRPLEAASFITDELLPRKFQAALAAIDPGPDPDPYPFWHSSQIAPPGRNLSDYSDPNIDDRLERGRQTTETARRKQLYAEFQDYLIAATPQIPLYAPVYAYVQRTNVQGFAGGLLFGPSCRFRNVREWYVRTRVQA